MHCGGFSNARDSRLGPRVYTLDPRLRDHLVHEMVTPQLTVSIIDPVVPLRILRKFWL